MNKISTPTIYQTDYLLKELVDLLKNHPVSAPRLMQNLLNVSYNAKDGIYNILNQEQREFLQQIYNRRKENKSFDQQFQMVIMIAAGIVGLGYGAAKLISHFQEKK
jgi:hypothetical protein